jgi:hypothetical protein
MTGAHIHSDSDRTSVPPKADVRAATAVSPAVVAATLSNSGDGLGIHEPGSLAWGGDVVATAPSGRADDSAKCPAVAGSLLEPALIPAFLPTPKLAGLASAGSALSFDAEVVALERAWLSPPALAECQGEEASAEQEDPGCGDGEVSLRNVVSISTHDTPVSSAPGDGADELIKDFGIAASEALPHFGILSDPSGVARDCIGEIDGDLEAAIAALEVSWLRAGICMNAITLRSVAVSETVSNSTSTVGA